MQYAHLKQFTILNSWFGMVVFCTVYMFLQMIR